jgi:hypothetical protein
MIKPPEEGACAKREKKNRRDIKNLGAGGDARRGHCIIKVEFKPAGCRVTLGFVGCGLWGALLKRSS